MGHNLATFLSFNLSLTYRESNLKMKRRMKGIEAMSSYKRVPSEGAKKLTEFFFSIFFL